MKTLVLGDIHGHNTWKDIIAKHTDLDRVIFIGDYVDSFGITGIEQLQNLNDIVKYKKEAKHEVILLIGNHDHHYWPRVGYTGTSGYQTKMKTEFEGVFSKHKDLFRMCFKDETGTFYSHAGISKMWLDAVGGALEADKEAFINELFITNPKIFCYNSVDRGGYGDHPIQSPIWIRPRALRNCALENLQVVGHTTQENIQRIWGPVGIEGYYLIDALPRQYLLKTDQHIEIMTYGT